MTTKAKKPRLITTFLKDKNVASIVPTSKKTVEKICKTINFKHDLLIVEYGPGNGPFTKYLLKKMTKNSKLIAIETNPDFVTYLSNIKDERLYVTQNSAQHVREILRAVDHDSADYIISGIPFSFLKAKTRDEILKDTCLSLKRNGKFIVYQVRPGIKLALSQFFPKIVSKKFRLNIPPLYAFVCSF